MSNAGLSLIIVFPRAEQRHVVQEVSGGCSQSHIALAKLNPRGRAPFAGSWGWGVFFFFLFNPTKVLSLVKPGTTIFY